MLSGGRSSEVAALRIERLEWNPQFKCVIGKNYQSKTSKDKAVMFVAGRTPCRCFFTALGDFLTVTNYQRNDVGLATFLLPHFRDTTQPGSKLTRYITDLCHNSTWADEWTTYIRKNEATEAAGILQLPESPSTRHGVIDFLSLIMPIEQVIEISGHDMAQVTRAGIYMGGSRANMVPGAMALAGWGRQPHWGAIGPCPTPPDLMGLANSEISRDQLDLFVDNLFRIDCSSPACLQSGAGLRPMLQVAAAGMIMAYKDRCSTMRCKRIPKSMKNAWVAVWRPQTIANSAFVEAHSTLIKWSDRIRNMFDIENQDITTMMPVGGAGAVSARLQQIETQVDRLSRTIFDAFLANHNDIMERLAVLGNCTTSGSTPNNATCDKKTESTTQSQPSSLTDIMVAAKRADPSDYSIKGKCAWEAVVDSYTKFNGRVLHADSIAGTIMGSADRDRFNKCTTILKSFANDDELTVLNNGSDLAEVSRIAQNLQRLTAWMFAGGLKSVNANFQGSRLWLGKYYFSSRDFLNQSLVSFVDSYMAVYI